MKLTEDENYGTVMLLSFRTDTPGQTAQTQVRLLLEQSDQGLHCSVISKGNSLWINFSFPNFRVITANFYGVQKFRKITIINFLCLEGKIKF